MKKRGSLNLSINAIVVLILAITMLGLGLSFMRNIFGGATEEFTKVSGTVEKQMIDQMKESNKVVDLSNPNLEIEIGGSDQIFIGLKNEQQAAMDFTINPIVCESLNPEQLVCGGATGVEINYIGTPQTIQGGEVKVLPINVKVSTQANEGTCYCNIDVADNEGGKETTELIVNVVV